MSNFNETWYAVFAGAAVKGIAVLCIAWLVALLLRGRSASARHLLWTATSAVLLALPFLTISLPALYVPLAGPLSAPSVTFQTSVLAPSVFSSSQVTPQPSPPAPLRHASPSVDWRSGLLLLWALGAIATLAPVLAGSATIWRMRRQAKSFADPNVADLKASLQIRQRVDILEGEPGSMPMVCGWIRPAVFLPADAAEWSQDRRRLVLLHELAHVRRGDLPAHLLARTALSLYWWNPLAWSAWRELLKERERATDDMVLSLGARASDYAGHLLEIARTMQAKSPEWAASIAVARESQLEGRLAAILDSRVNRKGPGRAWALAAALLAIAVVAPLAAVRAQDKQMETTPSDVEAAIRSATAQKNPQLLDDAAKGAPALGNYNLARKLLDASLKIRGEVSGTGSKEYGVGLLNLADLERARGKRAEADVFYSQAANVLGDRPEGALALIHLGTFQIISKNLDGAFEFFKRARLIDPANAGTALMWMAVTKARENDPEEADRLYRDALAIQEPTSKEAATTMELYAQFLRLQSRESDAKLMSDRAIAARKTQAPARSISSAYRIGNGVTSPAVIFKVEPEYTDEARAALLQGTESIALEIGPDGVPRELRVLRGVGLGLDEKGIEAVRQWKFKPGTKDGQPVTVSATIDVNWRLL